MKKYCITVGGKFVTGSLTLSDEYPDACLFSALTRANRAANSLSENPKFSSQQITIHENYGEASYSEYEVN